MGNRSLDEIVEIIEQIKIDRAEFAKKKHKSNVCPQCGLREVEVVDKTWTTIDVSCKCGYQATWD
jgi:lysyl-tRNA synthetase class I